MGDGHQCDALGLSCGIKNGLDIYANCARAFVYHYERLYRELQTKACDKTTLPWQYVASHHHSTRRSSR
jgi:hypothetical protein